MHKVIHPVIYVSLAIIFAAIFGADFALTEASLSTLLKDVEKMHEEFNAKAQRRYEQVASAPKIIEQKIQNAIDTIIEGRTSIVIAHRISTVKNADIILVVKDGKIVESGRHEELMAMKGYYHNLYTRQYEDEATSAFLG